MYPCRYPFGSHLVVLYPTISDRDLCIRYCRQARVFTSHNCSSAYKRLLMEAIFDYGMLGIIVVQLMDIAPRLPRNVVVMVVQMLLFIGTRGRRLPRSQRA